MLTDNIGDKVDRWTKKLRAGHNVRGINFDVKMTGFCCSCGKPLEKREAFVAEGVQGERCKWCYMRWLEE